MRTLHSEPSAPVKKAQQKIVDVETPIVSGLDSVGGDALAFHAWLAAVQCTSPFTLEDMKALQQMIKRWKPDKLVDVFDLDGHGKVVCVRVGGPEHLAGGLERRIAIT